MDFIGNAQYIFTSSGTSLGAYYWNGHFNKDAADDRYVLNSETGIIELEPGAPETTDKYTRYGVVGQFTEIKNLPLSAGYSEGKGKSDSAGAEDIKTRGWFGQAEYLIADKASVLFNVVHDDPDTSVSDDDTTIF